MINIFNFFDTITMLEKIKTLLDSGCQVKIDTKDGKYSCIVISYDDDKLYHTKGTIGCNGFAVVGQTFYPMDLNSAKPIAKPLYEYKVGDKVVVLDNYKGDELEIGGKYKVVASFLGSITIHRGRGKGSGVVDIRCIAPVLDY